MSDAASIMGLTGPVGVVGASSVDIDTLVGVMESDEQTTKAGLVFHHGPIDGVDCVVVYCGMGKVDAAVATQILIDDFSVAAVINTGAAGALSPELDVFSVVVSQDVLQHDVDSTALGWRPGEIDILEVVEFPANEAMRDAAYEAACAHPDCSHAMKGRIATGDQFISSMEEKDRIVSTFGADCAEMEGGAVAHVAYMNGVPFVVIRSISDKADGSATLSYREFEPVASRLCCEVIRGLLRKLKS